LVNDLWKNQTLKSIDSFAVCANCKLRKIFTLKNLPNSEFGFLTNDSYNSIDFPEETNSKIQIFNLIDVKTPEIPHNIPQNITSNFEFFVII
jgi:hypothetical protein